MSLGLPFIYCPKPNRKPLYFPMRLKHPDNVRIQSDSDKSLTTLALCFVFSSLMLADNRLVLYIELRIYLLLIFDFLSSTTSATIIIAEVSPSPKRSN